jgi:type II secretion system protein G
MMKKRTKTVQRGFTIIELVVVIVVIGILSAITIASYTAVQNRAADTAVQTDLKSVGASLKAYKALVGTYPTSSTQISTMTDPTGAVVTAAVPKVSHNGYSLITPSSSTDTTIRNILVCIRSGGSDPEFGIAALAKSGNVWFYTSNGGLSQSASVWSGVYGTECPLLSIQTTDTGFAYWFAYQRNPSTTDTDAGWLGWSVN